MDRGEGNWKSWGLRKKREWYKIVMLLVIISHTIKEGKDVSKKYVSMGVRCFSEHGFWYYERICAGVHYVVT